MERKRNANQPHGRRRWLAVPAALLAAAGLWWALAALGVLPGIRYTPGSGTEAVYPKCRFAVISDTHYFDPSLWDDGPAFKKYLATNTKMLGQTPGILDGAVDRVLASSVQFVLVSGDITKDGERVDHARVAEALSRLTKRGIKVYVVPGNHDVENPWSASLRGSAETPVPSVSAKEFADIYKDCGYGDAVERDPGSLSYVAEPVDGLWLVAMDSCRYYDNKKYHTAVTEGQLTQSEITWLEGVLKKAARQKKAVIVMMHHGLVEHWNGQSRLYPQYLLRDYRRVSEMLASYGVRLAFTGHFHSQDVAQADFGSRGFLVDMETGALPVSRCPVRICEIDGGQQLRYTTVNLADSLFPGQLFGGKSFAEAAENDLENAVTIQQYSFLRGQKVNARDAKMLSGAFAAAYLAHIHGDENPSLMPAVDTKQLEPWSQAVLLADRYILYGLWNDMSVGNDSDGTINLATGLAR